MARPESSSSADLFEVEAQTRQKALPLAVRMRPQSMEEFVGQQHLLGPGKLLRRAIDADRIASLILYGPPGTGKATLAHLIAASTQAHVDRINATTSNVAELRQRVQEAQQRQKLSGHRTLLFIDEIHRFNKAQQDVLMPHVEEANPILIGATTHNPFFTLASALLSRSLVFELEPLNEEDVVKLLRRAVADSQRGLGSIPLDVDDDAFRHLAKVCDGDARRALGALELGALTTQPNENGRIVFDRDVAAESIQKKAVVYDADGDAHYDAASAFIKSMRGSDPDAALYWMAKMLYAGEDPRFVARRMVICAAEDVGNADPQALVLASAAMQVSEFVGMPEARIPLAQAAVYIACAPKSNAAYLGIDAALKDVKEGRTLEVPPHLKDASYKSAKKLGHGQGYKYAHNYEGHHVDQDYLPVDKTYYQPTSQGFEARIKERLERLKKPRTGQS
ncbi:MAG: replication-associated recombination protein A [Candidatus Omnitrophica bacterium]|nr:replication-associated recombination protein A [Candidatus Omnitrophota bacterium]